MNELLTKATIMQVLEALVELPTALPALYSRMIHKIPADKLHTCVSILHWVALAERSLTVDELADAIDWYVPNQLTSKQAAQDYISLCKPLVSIQAGKVVLVHQSVKDYLLRIQPDNDPVVESVRIKPAESHLDMADRCMKVLGGNSALVDYATLHWPKHAKQSGSLVSPWIATNSHFFGTRSESRKCWWRTYTKMTMRTRLLPGNLPKLHIACYLGFTQWAEKILTTKRRLLKPWKRSLQESARGDGTPLHFAVWSREWNMVDFLLAKGADPNRDFRPQMSPFRYVMLFCNDSHGSSAVLRHMLDRGADANEMFFAAVDLANVDLLELAMMYNAKPNLQDAGFDGRSWGRTGLHKSVRAWNSDKHSVIIRKLLEAGADPLIEDQNGKTAIQYAENPRATAVLFKRKMKPEHFEEKSRVILGIFREFGFAPT